MKTTQVFDSVHQCNATSEASQRFLTILRFNSDSMSIDAVLSKYIRNRYLSFFSVVLIYMY